MSKRIARTVLFLLPLSLFVHIYWKLWKNKALRGTSPFKKTPRAVFLMLKKPGDVTLGDVLERWVCMMGSFNPQPGRIYSRMQKSMIQLPAPNPRRFLLDHKKYKQVLGWWSPSKSMVLEFSLGIFVSMHIYIYDHFFIADITVRLIYIFLSSASKWVAESSIETSQPRWFAGFWGDEILPSSIRIITDAIF